jgi:hypothetical protein
MKKLLGQGFRLLTIYISVYNPLNIYGYIY